MDEAFFTILIAIPALQGQQSAMLTPVIGVAADMPLDSNILTPLVIVVNPRSNLRDFPVDKKGRKFAVF